MFSFDEVLFNSAFGSIKNAKEQLDMLKELCTGINNTLEINDVSTEIVSVRNGIELTSAKIDELYIKADIATKLINYNVNPSELRNFVFSSNQSDLLLPVLTLISRYDPHVNSDGKFANFTDYQNIMLAYLGFINLFYPQLGYGDESTWGKTINDLFTDVNITKDRSVGSYLDFEFDSELLVSVSDPKVREEYLDLFLGKLVLCGYGDLKIEEIINGKDGFDAVVLRDKNNELLIFYPGTDVNEVDDLYYDANPIILREGEEIDNVGEGISLGVAYSLANPKFESQQSQAVELLKEYLNTGCSKVNVGGYSLGGSSGEHAYYTCYDYDNLGDIVLVNPYHTEINTEIFNDALAKGKLKLYAYEGDIVSKSIKFDNVEMYYKNTNVIPMNLENINLNASLDIASSNNNLTGRVINNLDLPYIGKRNITSGDPNEINNTIKGIILDDMFKGEIPNTSINSNSLNDTQTLEVAFAKLHMPTIIDEEKDIVFSHGKIIDNTSAKDFYINSNMGDILNRIKQYNQ